MNSRQFVFIGEDSCSVVLVARSCFVIWRAVPETEHIRRNRTRSDFPRNRAVEGRFPGHAEHRPEGAEQISLGQSDAARTASDALGGESLFSPYLPVPINFGMPKIGTYHHNPAAAISSTKSASSPSTSSTAASKSSESSSARDVTRAIGVFG